MSDVPVQVVVAAFQDPKGADEALKMLKEAKKERLIGIQDAAVISKDAKGKLHIKETADMGGGKGATIGGVAGGVIGAIAGAALAGPVLVGALVGGLAAKLKDSGFDNDRLRTVGESLPAGSSAIIAVIEHRWVEEVAKELAEAGADIVTEEIGAELAAQLEAGKDIAYTALATSEGVAAAAVVSDDDSSAGAAVVIERDEAAGVEYVLTEDGVVVHSVDLTEAGVTETLAAAVVDADEDSDGS